MIKWIIAAFFVGEVAGLVTAAILTGAYDQLMEWRREHAKRGKGHSYNHPDHYGGNDSRRGGNGRPDKAVDPLQAGEPGERAEKTEQKG